MLVSLLACEFPPEHRTAYTLAQYYTELPIPADAKVLTFLDTFVDATGRNVGLGEIKIELQLSDSQFVRVWSAAQGQKFRSIPGNDSTERFVRFLHPDVNGLFTITDEPRMNSFQLVLVDSARKMLIVEVQGDT